MRNTYYLKKTSSQEKSEAFSNNLKHFAEECKYLFHIRTSAKIDTKHKRNLEMSKKLAWKKNSAMVDVKSQWQIIHKLIHLFLSFNLSVNVNGLMIKQTY